MAELNIPITKAKASIVFDTSVMSDEMYEEILIQGLKVVLNRGTTKITKETYPDEDELKAAAMAKAEEQVEAVKSGTIRRTGSKAAAKESGEVMTEARRLAKNIVKDLMKAAGIKISHVEAKDITSAANELLKEDPSLIETAKANLEARKATPTKVDIKSLIKVSEKKVKAAEDKKLKDKAERGLSAKQAGKVAPRQKPKTGPQATQ